jgi:predicted 3-demethylubiquinone-9 3-methyltransferase (glyoxalase superfamily)
MQKITPFLWFDNKAEEAVNFYVSTFRNSSIGTVTRYREAAAAASGQPAEAQQCGWLKDRYGVSWQIVPAVLPKLLGKSPRVMQALLQMKKIDIADLQKAAA